MWIVEKLPAPFERVRGLENSLLEISVKSTAESYASINKAMIKLLSRLPDKLFLLAILDTHSIVKGRLKDWKEEDHEAEEYLSLIFGKEDNLEDS
ncbi:MAG: hypothetical protein QXQ94_02815 [Candidatus Bathyarchaeia archaeon]